MECKSSVVEFYQGKYVFLTGGTGAVGEVLVEKLLRSHVKILYILCRSKGSKSAVARMRDICATELFSKLRHIDADFFGRIRIVEGDVRYVGLGISAADRSELEHNVQLVIHGAADVRFETSLDSICMTNVRGTREMLSLAGTMKRLIAFAYVSTAFSHCPQLNVHERFYGSPIDPDAFIRLCQHFAHEPDAIDMLHALTSKFIAPWPNTYVFSKAVSEELMRRAATKLPIAVIRPSIVTVVAVDPVAGWGTNFYGLNGMLAAAGTGLMRVNLANPNNRAAIICTDHVVNATMAILWQIGQTKVNNNAKIVGADTAKVFNLNLAQKSLGNGNIVESSIKVYSDFPFRSAIWCPVSLYITNTALQKVAIFFVEFVPQLILDCLLMLAKSKKRTVPMIRKIRHFAQNITYFTTQQFTFQCDAIRELYKRLSDEDRLMFPCDLDAFNWEHFVYDYVLGIKSYILKEPLDKQHIECAKRQHYWLKMANSVVKISFFSILGYVLVVFVCSMFMK